jgi:tRNA (cmo5U34)-methyltransferase
MSETVVPQGWSSSDTDVFVRYGDACVPRRAEQVATVCDLLGEIPVPHVLDLCCGEGLLSEAYLRRHASGRVTILDGSAEMLAVASLRLAPFGDRAAAIQADIADSSWRDPSAGYGGVMTSLAVHHLDGAGKQALYRDIRAMLAPGGVFVMADLVEPTGPAARRLAADHWDAAVWAASEAMFGSDEAVIAFRETQWNYYRLAGPDDFDKPSSVAEHLTWLQAAGFTEVDLTWMYAGHAIFTATRPQDLDAP